MCLGVKRHLASGHEISRLQHDLQFIMAVRSTRLPNRFVEPVVKPVWQPVGNRLDVCLHDTDGCQTGCNRLYNLFDNRLYRVNGVSSSSPSFGPVSRMPSCWPICTCCWVQIMSGWLSLGHFQLACISASYCICCRYCVCQNVLWNSSPLVPSPLPPAGCSTSLPLCC